MNNLVMWYYIGWGIFGVITLGICFLSYALYADYVKNKDRALSLPSLDVIEANTTSEVFTAVPDKLVSDSSRASRRARLKSARKDYNADAAKQSSSFFEDESDESFTITSGKD